MRIPTVPFFLLMASFYFRRFRLPSIRSCLIGEWLANDAVTGNPDTQATAASCSVCHVHRGDWVSIFALITAIRGSLARMLRIASSDASRVMNATWGGLKFMPAKPALISAHSAVARRQVVSLDVGSNSGRTFGASGPVRATEARSASFLKVT